MTRSLIHPFSCHMHCICSNGLQVELLDFTPCCFWRHTQTRPLPSTRAVFCCLIHFSTSLSAGIEACKCCLTTHTLTPAWKPHQISWSSDFTCWPCCIYLSLVDTRLNIYSLQSVAVSADLRLLQTRSICPRTRMYTSSLWQTATMGGGGRGPPPPAVAVSTPGPWRWALLSWFGLPASVPEETEAAPSFSTQPRPTDTLQHTRKEHTHGYQEEQTQLLTALNKTMTTPTKKTHKWLHDTNTVKQTNKEHAQSRGTITDTSALTMTKMRKNLQDKPAITGNTYLSQGTNTPKTTHKHNMKKGDIWFVKNTVTHLW